MLPQEHIFAEIIDREIVFPDRDVRSVVLKQREGSREGGGETYSCIETMLSTEYCSTKEP